MVDVEKKKQGVGLHSRPELDGIIWRCILQCQQIDGYGLQTYCDGD